MPALSGVTRSTPVYSPCQTLPVPTPHNGLFMCLLGGIKNTARCFCRRPPEGPAGNTVKADIVAHVNEFFMHGKGILALNSNQQSVFDNFRSWIQQHQGSFTREDQQIIKDYCQEMKTIIFPTASDAQREKLEASVSAIEAIADRIFLDIPLVVRKSATPLA